MTLAVDTGSWTPTSIVIAVVFLAVVACLIWWLFDEPIEADRDEPAPAAEPEWLTNVEDLFDFPLDLRERA